MIIGIPKEIKNNENRVGITPPSVSTLVSAGHEVYIERNAGIGSEISDEKYIQAGANILGTAREVYEKVDMIIKVKEPQSEEYEFFREGLIMYTYLHLAAEEALTKALVEKKVTAIAFETVQSRNGTLPLLTPMSEVAGRMSIQVGAQFLERPAGGAGILLGGVPGVEPGNVVIVGGGVVGTNAAKMAVGMGAQVTILETSAERMRYLDDLFGGRVKTMISNKYNIAKESSQADLLIGAVLIPGTKAPCLVTEEMVANMKPRSVIVDVAIDQGGSIETIDRVTTHSNPVYLKHGVVHYSVANMPGAVARTSTYALTNCTIPYALQIANKGWKLAVEDDETLAKGVNVVDGKITYKAVAETFGLPYISLHEAM